MGKDSKDDTARMDAAKAQQTATAAMNQAKGAKIKAAQLAGEVKQLTARVDRLERQQDQEKFLKDLQQVIGGGYGQFSNPQDLQAFNQAFGQQMQSMFGNDPRMMGLMGGCQNNAFGAAMGRCGGGLTGPAPIGQMAGVGNVGGQPVGFSGSMFPV
jgi:hypothetical protein